MEDSPGLEPSRPRRKRQEAALSFRLPPLTNPEQAEIERKSLIE